MGLKQERNIVYCYGQAIAGNTATQQPPIMHNSFEKTKRASKAGRCVGGRIGKPNLNNIVTM